ncbi:carbonic anhydrase [Paenibacillus albidus]|nr:carbonic anhydrase family protein [Paenibacillus albidus]
MSNIKKISRILTPLMALSMLAGCGNSEPTGTAEATQQPAAAVSAQHAHWSYEGETSPEHWAELDQLFTTCKVGTAQSPINITHEKVKEDPGLSPIQTKYFPSRVSMVNNGHTIQVNLKNPDNQITIEGTSYTLQQFHFHLPSEHQIDGNNAEMELHFVHKSEDGKIAVLGALITAGAENTELNKLWSVLPAEESEQEVELDGMFDLNQLLPADMDSFRYQGSLTTPPCTEGVQWVVLEHPVQWSEAQVGKFEAIFPHDNRPVQSLGAREVESDH